MASVLVALLSVLVASSKLNFESSRPAGHAKYNPMPDYLLAMKLFGPATVQFFDFVTDGLIVWDLRFLKMEVHCAEAPEKFEEFKGCELWCQDEYSATGNAIGNLCENESCKGCSECLVCEP